MRQEKGLMMVHDDGETCRMNKGKLHAVKKVIDESQQDSETGMCVSEFV